MVGENGTPVTPDWQLPAVSTWCAALFGDDCNTCPEHHPLAMPALDGRGDN